MNSKVFLSSLTRIADLERQPYEIASIDRKHWRNGDYVLLETVHARGVLAQIETRSGRMAELVDGDLIVGALGHRHATLEAVGSFRDVEDDLRMELLTSAGLVGRLTSVSLNLSELVRVAYRGHLQRAGRSLGMPDFAVTEPLDGRYAIPTILVIGTSMSAGKTTVAKVIIRELKRMGLMVAGVKLTGAGRYRDILSMGDAGADHIHDFMDVGLPSSILPAEEFRGPLRCLLGLLSRKGPDVVVAEAGASPLEPYNGDTVMAELRDRVALRILCASDPYAVAGVQQAFGIQPDVVAGIATSTSAGIQLIRKLTGLKALNLLDPGAVPELRTMLETARTKWEG